VPGPETIAGRAPAELAAMDLSPGRSLALRAVAREIAAGRVSPEDPAGDARLLAIPEIGPWTVQCLGLFGRGDPDSLPAGDLVYLKLVGRLARLGRRATVDEVSESRGSGKLSLGLLAALWAASNGMGAISQTLNTAYNVKETRSWFKVHLVSALLTVALAVLIIGALAIVLYGGTIGDALASRYGFSSVFDLTWRILQWPIALGFVLATFSLIYNFAPNIPARERRWLSPGAS